MSALPKSWNWKNAMHFGRFQPVANKPNHQRGGMMSWRGLLWLTLALLLFLPQISIAAAHVGSHPAFPTPLADYPDMQGASAWEVLKARAVAEPFNLVATGIFVLAIIHTFLAPSFMQLAHRLEHQHQERFKEASKGKPAGVSGEVSFLARLCHFLGEVEAIFGIWVVPLMIAISIDKGWATARDYLGYGLNFTEPLFVVVIMTIASSRPILRLAEKVMGLFAGLGRRTVAAWWFSILTVGPVLGSFITEPAAMTICALLLTEKFYRYKPDLTFSYATLGLLFVNVSVGGTLTPFAAPPILMVAGVWNWDFLHMFQNFGWKAVLGIVTANLVYWVWFRKEFKWLQTGSPAQESLGPSEFAQDDVPHWVTTVHLLFMGWTVINAHYPALFVGGFLFYLAFLHATEHHQSELALRPALLVGFFLAGLVAHGGLQGWWIGPVLSRLEEVPLFFGATALTAFNDNAAITYLAAQVPGLSSTLQYAVVAGAVAGGGLTVIANAPNPAGQSILAQFFPNGVSAGKLFFGALIPTVIAIAAFLLLK
jgi:hypothetical protein